MAVKKKEPKIKSSHQVIVPRHNDEDPDEAVAKILTMPEVGAAGTIRGLNDIHDVNALTKILSQQTADVVGGNAGIFANQEFNQDVDQYLIDNELDTWGASIQTIVDDKLDELNADVEVGIKELVEAAIKAA